MKFAKNFMRVAMMAFAVVAMGACTPSDPVEGGDENKPAAVTFTVQAEAGETTATISISHNGTAENTWYGFLTDKVDEAALSLVYAMVGEVDAEDLQTGTTATVNLTDLELATSYKYVVFGVTADGAIYGTPGEATFTTEDGRSMSVNEAWTIEYVGDYTDESNNTVYTNCVSITSTDENTYYVDCFTAEGWADVQTDMYAYVEGLIAQMKAELPMLNEYYGTNMTFEEAYLYSGNDMATFGELDPGKYIAVAWGITADQKVSRLYATSAEFEVVEEEATPEYSAWLGNWTVTGPGSTYSAEAKDYVAGEVSFDITIYKNVNNKSFLVDGWNGVPDLPFVAAYDAEYDAFDVKGQVIAENVEFEDGSVATAIILGGVMGNNVYASYELAYAIHAEDGSVVVLPYKYDVGAEELFSFPEIIHFAQLEGKDGLYYLADIISSTTLSMAPAVAAPAEIMGLPKTMYAGKEIRTKFEKPLMLYTPGADKFTSFTLK